MKRYLLLFLACCSAAFSTGLASASDTPAAVTLRLAPAATEVAPNDQFTLEVRYDGAFSNGSIVGVFLSFDDQVISFVEGETNRTVFNDGLLTSEPHIAEPGVVSFSASSTTTVAQNDVLVATLTFSAIAAGQSAFQFLATPPRATEVYDSQFNTIPAALAGATVIIETPNKPSSWILS